ncbi:MAG: hypothetical protein U0U70_09275 [Chitinophagaceae bacterium]
MQENEFEKSVQQKMEGLQLTPSAAVWNEVKERIRMEKRRRRMVFWWMLPLMLAAGGTILYFSQVKKTGTGVIPQEETVAKAPGTGTTGASRTNEQPETNTTGLPVVTGEPGKEAVAMAEQPGQAGDHTIALPANATPTHRGVNRPGQKDLYRNQPADKNQTGYVAAQSPVKAEKNPTKDTENKDNEAQAVVSPVLQPVYNLPDVKTEKTNEHTTTADVTGPVEDRPDISVLRKEDAVIAKKEVSKQEKTKEPASPLKINTKKKWETGFLTGIGVSARIEPLTFGSFAKGSGQAQQFSNAVPNSPTYTPPGALLGRTLFQAGVYTRKQLSPKTAFTTGLVYANYSTKQETGSFIDSILVITSSRQGYVRADGFYRSGKIYVYNNKYFMVQLPLTFELIMNKDKLVPLSWVNGITPSLIAGTNSLVYNPSNATYYKDKTAYNNFQLFYHTGFEARFGEDSKHPVTAGITLNYGMIGLHKNGSTEKNNLLSFGFQLKYALKK